QPAPVHKTIGSRVPTIDSGLRRLSARPRPALMVAALAFTGMINAVSQTALIPVQSSLPVLLGSTREDTAWVITITLLVSAICMPISGRLGDMYGKRRVVIALTLLSLVGAVVCALAPDVQTLIIGRGLQGPGMGVIPLGIAILRDEMPRKLLSFSIGLVSATLGTGGAIGLPLGALITEYLDWHMMFWIVASALVIALISIVVVVPPSTLKQGGRFDFVSAIGLAVGLTGVLLALSKGGELGWGSPVVLMLSVGGAVVLLGWGFLQLHRSEPLVDLRVTSRRPLLLTNLASIAVGFSLFGSSIAFPQLLALPTSDGGLGLSMLTTGLVMMPTGLTMLFMSPLVGLLESRTGPKPLIISGSLMIGSAYLLGLALELNIWTILLATTAIGVGVGISYAAIPVLIMRAVPQSKTGAANGLNTLMRTLGISAASAAVAAILTASSHETSGIVAPTAAAFDAAFLCGAIAAALAAALASFIPRLMSEETNPTLPVPSALSGSAIDQ
ncbi:MFS transporter, partial [Rhodococcus koreensis]